MSVQTNINLQDLHMVVLKIKKIWVIFTHLKLWVAAARHNFKLVKIQINLIKGIYY